MPSSTFYNLHPQKQETILSASRREFSSVPFAEVSINRIIKTANISRGSFYTYFKDIYDLVDYLMRQFREDFFDRIRMQLVIHQGDLFEGMLDLHDELFQKYTNSNERIFFMNLASHFHSDLSTHMQKTEEMLERFSSMESIVMLIDKEKYSIESPRHGMRLIECSFVLLRHQLYQSMVRGYTQLEANKSLKAQYEMLFHGVQHKKVGD
ncbi:MAG: TetR family transcriptional regulator [bacterium]|jgi:AcrR family transcriptional regulator|nr:TetR family transcriptional regulator [bacterium]